MKEGTKSFNNVFLFVGLKTLRTSDFDCLVYDVNVHQFISHCLIPLDPCKNDPFLSSSVFEHWFCSSLLVVRAGRQWEYWRMERRSPQCRWGLALGKRLLKILLIKLGFLKKNWFICLKRRISLTIGQIGLSLCKTKKMFVCMSS